MRWDFNPWNYSHEELCSYIIAMFKVLPSNVFLTLQDLKFLEEYNISLRKLKLFLKELRASYHNNPYHNFVHAFDVAQMVYMILKNTNLMEYFGALEALGLLLSALCHDVSFNMKQDDNTRQGIQD